MMFPRMFRIKQVLDGPSLRDLSGKIHDSISVLDLCDRIEAGQSVAITAGSRGITDIVEILRSVVDECKGLDLKPFVVPAMGSHGGATPTGQKQILEHYGITEASMGCDIKSSMDVVQISEINRIPIFCDRNAWEADHIVVVARIKPHTSFDNEIESGLFKMMSVGLGKQKGAEYYHRAGHHYSYSEIFPAIGKEVLKTGKILFGLVIVENGYGHTARLEAILPKDFYDMERSLLLQAKSWLGRLPFDKLDLLIVDEMGKNISGTGMDPNVIGRPCIQKRPESPKIRHIFTRDLTPESEGNAIGIGMADFTTKRLIDKMSPAATYMNAITAGSVDITKVPMSFATDKEAIETALGLIGLIKSQDARIVRVKNTLHLIEMDASESLYEIVKGNDKISLLAKPMQLSFDINGNLFPF